jgi:hypothetical protein
MYTHITYEDQLDRLLKMDLKWSPKVVAWARRTVATESAMATKWNTSGETLRLTPLHKLGFITYVPPAQLFKLTLPKTVRETFRTFATLPRDRIEMKCTPSWYWNAFLTCNFW